jgi:hypothetical protein
MGIRIRGAEAKFGAHVSRCTGASATTTDLGSLDLA